MKLEIIESTKPIETPKTYNVMELERGVLYEVYGGVALNPAFKGAVVFKPLVVTTLPSLVLEDKRYAIVFNVPRCNPLSYFYFNEDITFIKHQGTLSFKTSNE